MDWSELINKSLEFGNVIAQKYGPMAWETMLLLKRIEGIQTLLGGSLLAIIVFTVGLCLWRIGAPIERKQTGDGGLCTIFGIAVATGGVVIFITTFGYIWNWVAVFYPELAIAHDLLEKVTR